MHSIDKRTNKLKLLSLTCHHQPAAMQIVLAKCQFLCFILLFSFTGSVTFSDIKAAPADSFLKQKYILNRMQRVADWQLNQWDTTGFTHPPADGKNAACYTGIYAL